LVICNVLCFWFIVLFLVISNIFVVFVYCFVFVYL